MSSAFCFSERLPDLIAVIAYNEVHQTMLEGVVQIAIRYRMSCDEKVEMQAYLVPLFGRLWAGSSFALGQLGLLDVPLFAARLDVNLQTLRAVLATADVALKCDRPRCGLLARVFEKYLHITNSSRKLLLVRLADEERDYY